MSDPLVVEAIRSGTVESTHLVDVAIVDRDGSIVACAGDPDRAAAFRSSAKPLQARVALEAGWEPADARALAIACASHSGSLHHLDAVVAVLRAAGLDESALLCPPALPLDAEQARAAPGPTRLQHNCSGKHASMLAACLAAGWDPTTYHSQQHPLQQRVLDRFTALLGPLPPPLVDGCGVPTVVAPLRAFAAAFLAVDDGGPEVAAMRTHPDLVGGGGRVDTIVMQTLPSLVAKGGAEALLCMSDGSIGIALKVRDGSPRAVGPAAFVVLDQLGFSVGEGLAEALTPVVAGGGEPVGSISGRGTLRR